MQMIKYILATFVLLANVMVSQAQVSVDSRIDQLEIPIGEQTDITITVKAKEGSSVVFPEYQQGSAIAPGVEIIESAQADTVDKKDGVITIDKRYTVTSFDEKLYYIPAQKVKVNGKTYSTKPLALKVLTVPVDTLHADQFYPPKDVQDNPFLWSEWSPIFWLSVLFIALLALTAYLVWRLKTNKPVISKIKIVKRLPPHQRAINGINKLKEERSMQLENQKEYYTHLTEILRKYISERFNFDAMEMTSSEIISRLRSEGNAAIDELVALFRTADLVKFAKHSAMDNENDANLVSALSFIDDTKQTEEKAPVHVKTEEERNAEKQRGKRMALRASIIVIALCALATLAVTLYQVYDLM